MPVHWYYSPPDIVRDFGRITDFQPPKVRHPSSIMSLSNTGGAGRGAQTGKIIGDLINHGKKQYWGVPNMHYHRGMAAGENTLNAVVARLLVRTMTSARGYSAASFLQAYVPFMTTPGTHNDTYAETYHRMFFKNYVAGRKPEKCADDDGHNVASMGGFVLLPPPALYAAAAHPELAGEGKSTAGLRTLAAAAKSTVEQMYTTHNSKDLEVHARLYAELLARVMYGADLKAACAETGKRLGHDLPKLVANSAKAGGDTAVIGGYVSSACYIDHSFPALLYLAYKYSDSPEQALIANTNVGGENCHRGAALGALMGAAHGMAGWPSRWVTGLHAKAEIETEASAFAELCATAHAAAVGQGSTQGKDL